MRVLIVEDDLMIGKALTQALTDAGIAVDWVKNGNDAGHALTRHSYSAVLLDLGLPDLDGNDILRKMRGGGDMTPVLIVTARDDLDTRIEGLDRGADDYIVKPFEIRELLARLRAVMRRRHGGQGVSVLTNGAISLDLHSHVVTFEGNDALLPAREFALMTALMERPGAIFSRAQLEEKIYGWGEEVESNAVDVLIHYIRRKLGKAIIRNVRGAGWTIDKAGR